MNVDITRILIRLSEAGSHYCPMCRMGPKHLANIDCLDKFWRPVLPRKIRLEDITRRCNFYQGTELMRIYENRELGYAVATVHFAFATVCLTGHSAYFWKAIVDFLEADVKIRELTDMKRPFELILHVLETLAWRSQDGQLFPMPLTVWFTLDGFLIRHKELHDLIAKIRVMEYLWVASPGGIV